MVNPAFSKPILFDNPGTYQIIVQGRINPSWSDRLEGMTIHLTSMESKPPITRLKGVLSDQAALAGVLNTIYEQHLTVLSVKRLDD